MTTVLTDGPHTVTATQVDPDGQLSAQSVPVTFTVDTTVGAPVVTAPTDGGTVNTPTPVISGTGEPGAVVTVTIAGLPPLTATVGPGGTWTVTAPPLGDGTFTVTATQTDPQGNVSTPSAPVTFTVDTTAAAPVIVAPAEGSTTTDTTPAISGTGEPGATVAVTVDGSFRGSAVVGTDGRWTFTSPTLVDGPHTVSVTQTDVAGNVSPASPTRNFVVDSTIPVVTITVPTEGQRFRDTTPTFSGTASVGSTVTPAARRRPARDGHRRERHRDLVVHPVGRAGRRPARAAGDGDRRGRDELGPERRGRLRHRRAAGDHRADRA